MHKKTKGNLRPDDFLRALITDTAPFEVPIVFSNDGFYKNYKDLSRYKSHAQHLISGIFKQNRYTIPYRYNIVKSTTATRQLSLIHPSVQINVCNFYKEYEDLICYYANLSSFSIRSPHHVGSHFFFPSSLIDKNKYRTSSIDTVEVEKFTRNPASYFAYAGYDRLYKFFNSREFLRLEKKYCIMISLDVAKCFDSIYTHSIAWALKDISTAKQNISSNHFGSDFDSLMQRMNYNETNGICIGAEVSRIFSEIILGKIDLNVENALAKRGLKHARDYEIRRYVDNYYVFINSQDVAQKVQSCISTHLKEFKLNLNEGKIEKLSRPFYTKKSKIINDANRTIKEFIDKVIETGESSETRFTYPIKVVRYEALLQSLIRSIKSDCYNAQVGYEEVANYLISAFGRRLIKLVDDYDTASAAAGVAEEDNYIYTILILLELSFFFYSMSPTVASSLALSKSILVAAEFGRQRYIDRLPFIQESIVRWTAQLMRDPRLIALSRNSDAIPVEILNILIAMHGIIADHAFSEDAFREIFFDLGNLKYFSLMSCLFIIRDNPKLDALRRDVFLRIQSLLRDSKELSASAHDVHLLLDTLACPFLPHAERVVLYKEASKRFNLPSLSNAEAAEAVTELEEHPWFISWRGVELLNLITKKELSSVY